MTEGNDWLATLTERGQRHVIPRNDLRPHTEHEGCWCAPTDDDGVLVHHSMDRREIYETGRIKVS